MKPVLSDEALIKAHLQAADSDAAKASLASTEAGAFILKTDPERRAKLAALALELWIKDGFRDGGKITSALLRANQKDWTAERLVPVVEAAAGLHREHPQFGWFQWFPHKPLISAVEKVAANPPLSNQLRAALERWQAALMPRPLTPTEERQFGEAERFVADDLENVPWAKASAAFETIERLNRIRIPLAEERRLIERLARLLAAANPQPSASAEPVVRIDTTDAVGIKIAADRAKNGRATGRSWSGLLHHARALTAKTPPPGWLEEAARLVGAVPPDPFAACVADWFNEAGKAAPEALASYRGIADATLFNDCSVELLRGLAWAAVAAGRVELAPALGNLAEACYKKVPNIGPRNVRLGNAAVAALAAMEKPEAVAQLSRLRLRVRHPSSRATVDKAFAAVSRKTGIAPDDLAEMSVPAFGLDKAGHRPFTIGDHPAELHVVDSQKVALRWKDPRAGWTEAIPAVIKKQHPDELKRWQREAKDASLMLAAQNLRLERSFLNGRTWPFETWRKRFLQHPLTGTLSRRLIWQIEETAAFLSGDRFLTLTGRPVAPKKDSVISLWHPIGSRPDEVMAWRSWLEQHEVTQPFKQAHREIYVLTDAERKTKSYSARFAAHILRQHQFAALCQQRGWEYRLQGEFDSHNTPTLHLPAQGLTVEFWVEAIQGQVSPQAIFLYVATDQVRFGRPLSDLPPVVFSEVMRDIDLFVGVASVANDPTGHDAGPAGQFRAYWQHWSFGALSETSLTRKHALQSLLPKLSIARQCSLTDKFLVLKGALRTYKIHLGSGNILMEPNDQYLCIVPDRKRAAWSSGRVILPFEGDHTLSVILSKAFLLAQDSKIKDPTIRRQITPP